METKNIINFKEAATYREETVDLWTRKEKLELFEEFRPNILSWKHTN